MGKGTSGYVNLVQKLLIALSEGKADVEVKYVPVSRTPYVTVGMPGGYDALAAVREAACLALAVRGFVPAGGGHMRKATSEGHLYVEVWGVAFDRVAGGATLRVEFSGPYPVEQDLGGPRRDPVAERAAYARDEAAHEEMRFWRLEGMRSLVRTMLVSTPFRVPAGTMTELASMSDETRLRAVSRALAAGHRDLGAFLSAIGHATAPEAA